MKLRLACAVMLFGVLGGALGALPAMAAPKQKTAVEDVKDAIGDTSGNGTVAAAPTDEEAQKAFMAARHSFEVSATLGDVHRAGDVNMSVSATQDVKIAGGRPQNFALENIRLVLDVENVTLREVVTRIVQQAAQYTGDWTVKWRLKPENMALLDERVNLTAEAPFGEFCNLLTERVKNMTGTQLYVTAFQGSRILLVTDTYY